MTVNALKRLRYSNDIIDMVSILVAKHMFTDRSGEKGIRRLIKSVGQDLIYDLLDIRRADIIAQGMGQEPSEVDEFEARVRAEIEKKPPFGLKDLKITGYDIMQEFNLQPGPLVGKILGDLLETVLDNPASNNYETLIAQASQFLAEKGKAE
jgi:poly(A) polymerase/tRNA nucleotidyltransferase (CCA-adding enzyme)